MSSKDNITLRDVYTQGKLSVGQHYLMRDEYISVYRILKIGDNDVDIECVIDMLYPEDIGVKFQFMVKDCFGDVLVENIIEIRAKYL